MLTHSRFTSQSMDARDSSYKKWRFQAEGEPSRSTLWRRKKLKRKIQSHREDELCYNETSQHQQDCQDQDRGEHGSGTTSKLQSGTLVVEMMQTIQSDFTFSDQFCLGKRHFCSFKSQAEQINIFAQCLRDV